MARIDITVDTTSLDLAPVELDTHLVDAVDELAEMGRARVTEELPRAFDRPSPFTMRGIGTRPASAGTPEATVDVLPQQSKYLSYEILGGDPACGRLRHDPSRAARPGARRAPGRLRQPLPQFRAHRPPRS